MSESQALQPNFATWALLAEAFKPNGDANAVMYCAHRLQKLHGTDPDLPIKAGPRSFLAITNDGHWGRGKTLAEAATTARKAGGASGSKVFGVLVLNDATPEVNQAGEVIGESDCAILNLGWVGSIASILKANKP